MRQAKLKGPASTRLNTTQQVRIYSSTRGGFTLLELLVASVILTLLSVVIVQVFFSTIRTNNKTDVTQDVKGNGDHSIEVITRFVQNAQSISLPASCPERPAVGTALDQITLTNWDDGVTTFGCILVGGVARIASISASQTVYLTSANVTLVDPVLHTNACTNHALTFTCSAAAGVPTSITVGFQIRQKNSAASVIDQASQTFQSTVTLRNK